MNEVIMGVLSAGLVRYTGRQQNGMHNNEVTMVKIYIKYIYYESG